jgi:hypothetical protein
MTSFLINGRGDLEWVSGCREILIPEDLGAMICINKRTVYGVRCKVHGIWANSVVLDYLVP